MLEPGWEEEVLLYGGGGRQRTCRVAASTGGGVVGTLETPPSRRLPSDPLNEGARPRQQFRFVRSVAYWPWSMEVREPAVRHLLRHYFRVVLFSTVALLLLTKSGLVPWYPARGIASNATTNRRDALASR